jgi:alpha-tubulin suppressor-like RCC1 family protein
MHPCTTGLALGDTHTCAVRSDGTARCWGKYADGQLGIGALDGGTANSIVDAPTAVAGLTDAVTIAAGTKHTCALTSAKEVWCWGNNVFGQLGTGDTAASLHAVRVTTLDGTIDAGDDGGATAVPFTAASLSLGTSHTCAVGSTAAGTTSCWGRNATGQLGNGAIAPPTATRPLGAEGAGYVAVSAGSTFTCALDGAGAVSCWGDNSRGEVALGDALATRVMPHPTKVRLAAKAVAVTAGQSHACALLADSSMACWGDNAVGQLALPADDGGVVPSYADVASTVAKLPTGVTQIAAGAKHTCAVTASGDVYCWGDNTYFQRGTDNATPPIEPTKVDGVSDAVEVRAGSGHTCARVKSGTVYCWGRNASGQVGHVVSAEGVLTDKVPTPTAIEAP